VNTGAPRGLPATKPVDVFGVTVTDDDVWIEV
jgi:nitrite reductase/ring-hydroxylating ferredoxin subunit